MVNIHMTDDESMLVELLIPVINNSGTARMTGCSFKLSECRKALAFGRPDVLLLDISLPDGNGIEFCAELHKKYPQMKIIALTGHDEHSSVMMMLKNGASGYVIKSEAVSEILEAIDTVMRGEIYISNRMEQSMKKTTKETIIPTPREKEVLLMVAQGMSNPQIAERMEIGLATVLSFRKKLNLKLHASNPVELVANARKEGLID